MMRKYEGSQKRGKGKTDGVATFFRKSNLHASVVQEADAGEK